MGTDNSLGNNGAFRFRHEGYEFHVIASDGTTSEEEIFWEHVSVTIDRNRCPSWEQMCLVKKMFWDEEDTVIQFHPKKSEYVNRHNYCLHLWRNPKYEIVTPPTILI